MSDELTRAEVEKLAERLRGRYPVGPPTAGEPEFGYRQFPPTPINVEAADAIDGLLSALATRDRRIEELERELGADQARLDYLEGEWLREEVWRDAANLKIPAPRSLFRENQPITRVTIDRARAALAAERGAHSGRSLDIVMTVAPHPHGEFVEAEVDGQSVRAGEWGAYAQGRLVALRITHADFERVVGPFAPDAEYLRKYAEAVLAAARKRAEAAYNAVIDDCRDTREAWNHAREAISNEH